MKALFSWWGAKGKTSRSASTHDGDPSPKEQSTKRKSTFQVNNADPRPEILEFSQEDVLQQPHSSCDYQEDRPHGRLRGKGPNSSKRSRYIPNTDNKALKPVEITAQAPHPQDAKKEGDELNEPTIQRDYQRRHHEDTGPTGLLDVSKSLLAPSSLESEEFVTIPAVLVSRNSIQPSKEIYNSQRTQVLQAHPVPVLPLSHTKEIFDLSGSVTKSSQHSVFDGTYSTVFVGRWNGKKVAIKQIRGAGSLATTRRKVRREREVWGRLNHPNILPLYGFSEDFGIYGALISPWCENGNVGSYIRSTQVEPRRRFQWWCDVVKGVEYLHSHDPVVIHGDLKPSNVLIDDEGNARLCDFGLVRILSEGRTGFTTTTSHTGTIRYLAHELVDSDESTVPTTASDVHALGCMALEVIFLRSPYANNRTTGQIYKDIFFRNIPPATQLPATSEPPASINALWDLITACWNINPAIRPSTYDITEFTKNQRSSVIAAFEGGFVPAPALLV